MTSWTDIQNKVAISGTHRYGDGVVWGYSALGVTDDGSAPRAYDAALVTAVFATFGNTLRSVATAEDVPVELLAAPICMVAERMGAEAAAAYADYLPGFMGDDETPELVYVGCTGLRFDRVRAVLGPISVAGYIADPTTAITAAARHILGQTDTTRFQVPMVASAYDMDGVRYDGTSRWRMAPETQIDRFVWWFNTVIQAAQFNPTLCADAPSFSSVLATIAAPSPNPPTPTQPSDYRRPESQAAIDAGMMTLCETNPGLSTIWSLDTRTTTEIKGVANDASNPIIGLPGGLPMFYYPDRGGTMRAMNATEVIGLYKAMRDYINAVSYFDSGRSPSLPGQPVLLVV